MTESSAKKWSQTCLPGTQRFMQQHRLERFLSAQPCKEDSYSEVKQFQASVQQLPRGMESVCVYRSGCGRTDR
jgi:hypothetical protein